MERCCNFLGITYREMCTAENFFNEVHFHTEKQQNNMQCPDGTKITNAVIEFVMQEEGGDVETLRKALYCQASSMHYTLLAWSQFALCCPVASVHYISCLI